MQVFNQCDRDGSGYITRDELAALCRSYDHHPEEGNMSPGRLDALMASLDVDNDGYISFDEFKAGFQVSNARYWQELSYYFDFIFRHTVVVIRWHPLEIM